MTVALLSPGERSRLLPELDGWVVDTARDALRRRFAFEDFTQAFAFMTKIAAFAEAADHHPEWSNVYNRVDIVLTTHDAGGLSMRDVALAQAISAAYGDRQNRIVEPDIPHSGVRAGESGPSAQRVL